jgi:superfamily II DNA or RNA helicase
MTARQDVWDLHELGSPHAFRRHQREALEAVDRARANGARRAWVVLPPGAGKTLVGLETALRRGHRTVALGPNTAIQQQWLRGWDGFLPEAGHPARSGSDRDLGTFFTALTYQSLATFLPDDEVDEEGHEQSLSARLHPNGRALVDRLKGAGDVTVVLDECHHLLEVWGRLLAEVLLEVPNAFVLGLTATPPTTLTAPQRDLVDELFGGIVHETSVPAVVREGDLAPFAELAWLTSPTPRERDYVAGQSERFAELVHGLTDPRFGTVGFLEWVDRRFVDVTTTVPWQRLSRESPDLCDAALRLHHQGLLALPAGARVHEQHRRPPTAEDWVLLVDDWARRCLGDSGDPADAEVVATIRRALPAVGYRWTRAGIRSGRSPVDRVLARSAAKTDALLDIVALEHRNLGDRLRMLVLCDHERASSVLPVDLHGVMPEEAGSAQLALERLVTDPRTAELAPILVTGSRLSASVRTLERLRTAIGVEDAELAHRLVTDEPARPVATLTGPWDSRDWVAWATRFFEDGDCRVLVGTRALLGEGWDAPAVTGLVDLTTATTSTAVVQTRGRALRLDPRWPDKVALTWSVVCVTDEHPKGAADWDRFVRKHDGFFGVDEHGDVVDGVAHVHARFSPYVPPPLPELDACNAAMVARSEDRTSIAERWQVGAPYEDTRMHTLRIVPAARARRPPAAEPERAGTSTGPPLVVPRPTGLELRPGAARPWRPHPGAVLGVLVGLAAVLLTPAGPALALLGGLAVGGLVQAGVAAERGRAHLRLAGDPPALDAVARALADGLHAAGMSPRGADAVRVDVEPDGEYRCALADVAADVSRVFATALDEVVSPMTSPRYVVPRYVVFPPPAGAAGLVAGLGAAVRRTRPDGEVWHTVPAVLGSRAELAAIFAHAWDHWVGGGGPVYTGSPIGAGVLATHRGSDPFAATTMLRLHWR